MARFKILISYEGTNYVGWQIQPLGLSIQGQIEKALQTVLRHPVRIVGAGRTDAGVHAQGQVAHFSTEVVFDRSRLVYSLSRLLPPDIRVWEISEVDESFHAQISAKRKIYSYRVWEGSLVDPFVRRIVTPVHRPLSLPAIDQALIHFQGTHDFTTFANHGSVVRSMTRTLYRVERIPQHGGFSIEFEGDGFLYKMVRNIMGLILAIGEGDQSSDSIPNLFFQKDRRVIGAAAPPTGLCLVKVIYE